MPPSHARAFLGLLILLAAGCEFGEVHKPTPPDTETARRLLTDPDGHFADGANAAERFEALAMAMDNFDALCGYNPLTNPACLSDPGCRRCAVLGELRDSLDKVADALEASRSDAGTDDAGGQPPPIPGLQGVLDIDANCKGFASNPKPDPDNGYIHATLGFTLRGLDPVVWGNFDDCALLSDDKPIRANGDFTLEFDAQAVPRSALETTPALFSFQGRVLDTAVNQNYQGRLLVYQRLDGTGRVSVGVGDQANGTFVLGANGDSAELGGAEGTFLCDINESTCTLVQDP